MSFMIVVKWYHPIPLNAMPSFAILLFTDFLISNTVFFKCGSIQNGAWVSGYMQAFNLIPGQWSVLHV